MDRDDRDRPLEEMHMNVWLARLRLVSFVLLAALGCKSSDPADDGPPATTPAEPGLLVVSPVGLALKVGQTVHLSASLVDSSGAER
jgi:hypothetical protein